MLVKLLFYIDFPPMIYISIPRWIIVCVCIFFLWNKVVTLNYLFTALAQEYCPSCPNPLIWCHAHQASHISSGKEILNEPFPGGPENSWTESLSDGRDSEILHSLLWESRTLLNLWPATLDSLYPFSYLLSLPLVVGSLFGHLLFPGSLRLMRKKDGSPPGSLIPIDLHG